MFIIPSDNLSHVHIALNHVTLIQDIYCFCKSPDFPLLKLEIEN